ncbi:MAG: hypothetical protein QM676_10525 [Novosphingobium sp.]
MRMIWTMPLLLIGTAAHANGFSAADLAGAAQTADARQAELVREADRLRLAVAYDTAAGLGSRAENERSALLAALPTGEGLGDQRVKWFMAGAIAQPSRGSTTILYNPLARGTLALDWAKGADGWQVTHAWLSSSGPAMWPAQRVPWRKAFVDDYAWSRAFGGDEGRDWVAFESDRWLGGLARWVKAPANHRALTAAGKLIAAGRTARAGGGNIDLIPERARKTYAPLGALPRSDGGTAVLFGSAVTPHLMIAADFASDARLEKLSLINLGNAGEGK